jgi:hypothetical protein
MTHYRTHILRGASRFTQQNTCEEIVLVINGRCPARDPADKAPLPAEGAIAP